MTGPLSKKSRTSQWTVLWLLITLLVPGCNSFAPKATVRDLQQVSSTNLRLFSNLIPQPLLRKTVSKNSVDQQQQHLNRDTGSLNGEYASNISQIPFVIERLGDRPGDQVFKDIAEMCISVFFNGGKLGKAMPPWKEAQLSYLRLIQTADLKRRRLRDQRTNAMFVAYKVEEASSTAFQSRPLILNLDEVHNFDSYASSGEIDYVRGDVLGFCEVSMVPFGLSANPYNPVSALEDRNFYDDEDNDNNDIINRQRMIPKRMRPSEVERPVLTNLSVKLEARESGVGSKLLAACERAARLWGKNEMVLEVEEENVAAQKWYQKRGYRVLFSDPTSKRYDVNGLMLKKVKCTRQVLRKSLVFRHPQTQVVGNDVVKSTLDNFGLGALRRLRDSVLQGSDS